MERVKADDARGRFPRKSRGLRARNVPAHNVPKTLARIIVGLPGGNGPGSAAPARGPQQRAAAPPSEIDSDSDSDNETPPARVKPNPAVRAGTSTSLSTLTLVVSSAPKLTTAPNLVAPQRPVATSSRVPALNAISRTSQSVRQQQTTLSSSAERSSSFSTSSTQATETKSSATSVDAGIKAASPTPEEPDPKREGRLDGGAEAGIVVGVLAFIILLSFTIFLFRRYRRRRSGNQPPMATMLSDRMISAPMPARRQSDAMTVNVGYYDAANRRPSEPQGMVQEPQPASMARSGENEYFQRRVLAEPSPEMAEGAAERSHEPTHFI
ncbi:hypothetical protein XA68_15675 [Ophiocordyceps unilateralis]|uniref:Uncharacterized protein n=1 Tax=Ophiocordyceps unilateralis TaxID=268505 RepID=A0A2A9P644_OPHUN|nr:hypothetical protein XA68_15675 [Ophiocordyceps unilateralis]